MLEGRSGGEAGCGAQLLDQLPRVRRVQQVDVALFVGSFGGTSKNNIGT